MAAVLTSQAKTRIPIVFGCMTFGASGQPHARVHELDTCKEILDIFQSRGHNRLDTARIYCGGTSEEYLGQLDWASRGIIMDTKYYPAPNLGNHSPEDLRRNLADSLKALKTEKVNMWYLHGPDRKTPFDVTLKTVNDLYKEGHFDSFGISNYRADEVEEICTLCDTNGWIKPKVYQGNYNSIARAVEKELFPVLRKHNMSFFAFSPLAGGFYAERFTSPTETVEAGSRFDKSHAQGQLFHNRYVNDHYYAALGLLKPVVAKHELTMAEVALRWMVHHSFLDPTKGDALIIGASSVKHTESNLVDLEKGPLPEEVVNAMNEAWKIVEPHQFNYYH